jgi:hypothetical protein
MIGRDVTERRIRRDLELHQWTFSKMVGAMVLMLGFRKHRGSIERNRQASYFF